jgi:2-polyprenyl-6-methoxyphenol hydroxylase-like FAD-dependent oxidoreductase
VIGEFKRPHYECSEATLPGQFKVMVQSSQASQLDSSSIHLLTPSNGFSLFVVPAPGNIFCTLVNWSGTSPPKALSEATTADALSGAIGQAFPKLGPVMAEAAEQLLRQKASVAQTIQCNTYTDNRGVLLLGDAAHSTGGTLGQGANSALMDVVALDACLDEAGDDLGRALPLFSNRQTVEGLALWKLLQLPPKGLIGLLFAVMQAFRPYIRRVRKRWPKPVQTELSQSLTPFSEIVEENSFWLRWTGRMQNSVKPIRHNL